MSDKYEEEDLVLQNAIGDVFTNLDLYGVDKDAPKDGSVSPQHESLSHQESTGDNQQSSAEHGSYGHTDDQTQQGHHEYDGEGEGNHQGHLEHHHAEMSAGLDDDDLDINFDDAINDAFKSLQDSGIRHSEPEHSHRDNTNEETSESQHQGSNENNDNDHANESKGSNDHEDNIQSQQEAEEIPHQHSEPQDGGTAEGGEGNDGDADLDLANAISNALQSIDTIQEPDKPSEGSEQAQEPSSTQQDQSGQQEEEVAHKSSDESKEVVYSPLQMEKHYDAEMEGTDEDLDLQNAIGSAFESLKKNNQLGDQDLSQAIADSLQNFTGDAIPEGLNDLTSKTAQDLQSKIKEAGHISDDLLQELAKEITSKVSEIDDNNKAKNKYLELPKIDDQVLDHFVNEANRSKETEPSNEDAGDEVNHSVEEHKDDEMIVDDDDQLQSTIANAMKSLISDHKEPKDDSLNNLQMNDILTNAFNMAMENPTELLDNLENDELKNRDDFYKTPDISKRLSIFDTLNVRRPLDLNNQLSSMMMSLSKNNDSNLITVIKSLTNFLTNSNFQIFKNSQSLISIINQYKNNDFEKMFINALNLSKNYLRSNNKNKCIVAIDNILILFGKSTTGDILNYNFNLITLITNSIISCITNSSSLKSFKNSIFKKPRLSEMEYKEKIRIENRERKKRWREENKERNKDNDLRSRVLKRANTIFGSDDSKEKSNWVEEEFTRRKERRQVKEKKDMGSDSMGSNSSKEFDNEQFIQDKNLIQLVTDFFNIFSNFAPRDDSETGLFTTAVSIACISIIYLLNFSPNFEFKRIDTIVSSIMNNLLNAFNSIDQQERLIYLARGSNVKLNNMDSSFNDEMNYNINPNLDISSDLNHRKSSETSTPENEDNVKVKKPKTVKADGVTPVNLKFPSYKSNDTGKKPSTPLSTTTSGLSMNLKNLKKPGTFKRPIYGDKKGKSLGFPPFYSTSIKH